MNTVRSPRLVAFSIVSVVLALGGLPGAQTREKGPWWPSPHGAKDRAGNSNLITPDKIMKALGIPKTGRPTGSGRIYGPGMPTVWQPSLLRFRKLGGPRRKNSSGRWTLTRIDRPRLSFAGECDRMQGHACPKQTETLGVQAGDDHDEARGLHRHCRRSCRELLDPRAVSARHLARFGDGR